MADDFFGLSFKGATGAAPQMPPDDPELQQILWRLRKPQDEVVTPPADPYEGKGFGRQFVQALKDELTGGVERRQTGYDNQVRQAQLRNARQQLAYQGEGLGYEGRRTTVAESVNERAEREAAEKRAARALLPAGLQPVSHFNESEVKWDRVASPEEQNRVAIRKANAERQGLNVGFFGPSGVRDPDGTTLEEDFAASQAAPSRPLLTGLRPAGQSTPGPMDASFAPPPVGAPAARRELGPMTPRVLGQPMNPFDPKSKMMAGGVESNPDAGSLFRETALGTVKSGPMGYETQGNIEQSNEGWHPNPQGELTMNQRILATARLQADWDRASADYREIKQQAAMMQSGMTAARAGNRAQGAQAVLVTFQKILDPRSVVRESEYARSSAGLALLAQIQGYAENLALGGANVPLAELEQFAALAQQFVQNADNGLQGRRTRLEKTAQAYGVDPNLIFDSDAGKAPAAAPPRPPGVPESAVWTPDPSKPGGGSWKG